MANILGLTESLMSDVLFECISSEGILKEAKISYENGDVYQGEVHNSFLVPLGSGTLTTSSA